MRFWSVSRAFIREDVDPPERSGRKRSASGLPPGAVNYITARGAARLQAELAALCAAGHKPKRITELKQVLSSIKIVEPPEGPSKSVSFGTTVTLRDPHDKTETHTIVGVDELDFESDALSWISPLGKALRVAIGRSHHFGRRPHRKNRQDRIVSAVRFRKGNGIERGGGKT